MKKVYLASPLGFTASTIKFMERIEKQISELGTYVFNPWNSTCGDPFYITKGIQDITELRNKFREINTRIAETNENAIRESSIVVAILDGIDVDSGTASEIGFAYALGKTIYGYRGDSRQTGDNAGSVVNLQVQYWIEKSGGVITTEIEELLEYIKSCISVS